MDTSRGRSFIPLDWRGVVGSVTRIVATAAVMGVTSARVERAIAQVRTDDLRFAYSRDPMSRSCPDEDELRQAIAAHLGRDPGGADSRHRVRVTIVNASGSDLEARIHVVDEAGRVGERTLTGSIDCRDLAESIALAVALAMDSSPSRASAAPGRPPLGPLARERAQPPVERPAPPTNEIDWGVLGTAGIGGSVGSVPNFGFNFMAGAELRVGRFSVGLAARIDVPVANTTSLGAVEGQILVAELSACGRFEPFVACLLGQGGVFRGAGRRVVDAREVTNPYGAIGARAAVDAQLDASFALRFGVDILAPLARTTLTIGDVSAWGTSPVAGQLHASVLLDFS